MRSPVSILFLLLTLTLTGSSQPTTAGADSLTPDTERIGANAASRHQPAQEDPDSSGAEPARFAVGAVASDSGGKDTHSPGARQVQTRQHQDTPGAGARQTRAANPADSPGAGDRLRSVVLVTVDTLRADRLGCYGGKSPATPAYDRLAREGTLFENAVATNPLTLPSHASMLTGRHSFEHGVRGNGNFALPASEETLATILSRGGFATAAFVGAFPLAYRFGLGRGFTVYDDDFGTRKDPAGALVPRSERRAREVNARALPWLREHAKERFFLWVHYYDPHYEYRPEEPFASRYSKTPYDGEVAATDEALGEVLKTIDAAGISATTAVVVVSDHGEGLGDHGEAFHGIFLYDSTIHVPMLVRAPGVTTAGSRVTATVSGADVAPTVLDMLGVAVPRSMSGRPATGFMNTAASRAAGASDSLESGVPSLSDGPWLEFRWSPLRAWRSRNWKYVEAPEPELYDLASDAGETKNLASAKPDVVMTARRALEARAGASITGGAGSGSAPSTAIAADAETIERLRSLGYVASSAAPPAPLPGPAAGRPLKDPKTMRGYEEAYYKAVALLNGGRAREALEDLQRLLGRDPDAPFIHLKLARAYYILGRYDESEAALTRALALAPAMAEAAYDMGAGREARKDFEGATGWFRRAVAINPAYPEARAALARRLFAKGDLAGAEEQMRAAVALSPSDATLRRALEDLEKRRGR